MMQLVFGIALVFGLASAIHAAEAPSESWVHVKTLSDVERPAGWCGTSDQIIYQTLKQGLVVENVLTGKSHKFSNIRSASNISCSADGTHLLQVTPTNLAGYDMSGAQVLDMPITSQVFLASDSDSAMVVGGSEDIMTPWGSIKTINLPNRFLKPRLRKLAMARGRVAIQAEQNRFGGGDAYLADLADMKVCSLGHYDRLERVEYAGNRVVVFKNIQFDAEKILPNGQVQTGEILAMVYAIAQNCRMTHEFDVHAATCFDLANDGSFAHCAGKEVRVCERSIDQCKIVAATSEEMLTTVSFSADGSKLLVYDTAPAKKPFPGGPYHATTQVFKRTIK